MSSPPQGGVLCFYPVKILGSSLLTACMGEVILHWPPGPALIVTLSLGLKPHHAILLFETLQKLPFPTYSDSKSFLYTTALCDVSPSSPICCHPQMPPPLCPIQFFKLPPQGLGTSSSIFAMYLRVSLPPSLWVFATVVG